MIDMHYDLLSILYHCYKRDDYSYIKKLQEYYQQSGVKGIVANLYFMNEEEMKSEFGTYYEPIDVVEMFRISTLLYKKYFSQIPVVFSIEGCDYIEGPNELEKLYQLGLRNILLVWNNENKYGSGIRGTSGLTDDGRKLLQKAIELGISIDLSHMNSTTFYDVISLLQEQKNKGADIKVIASHSNCYGLYAHPRNLTDEQLLAMKEFQPLVGVVSYGPFVSSAQDKEELYQQYLAHIQHIVELLGLDAVSVSTDDMTFCSYLFGDEESLQVFDYSDVYSQLVELLKEKYQDNQINKILYENSYNKLFEEKR